MLVWLLLSVILFVQQGTRYSDLIFDASLPDYLIWQLAVALIPNVIAFTGPVALLVGTVIGLSRMQGDSEMTALRAAGVGNGQILAPVLVLGVLVSILAFFVNLRGVPFAAQIVRQVAIKAALFKLDSPVDPGIFNTEIEDLTIFVREGDVSSGKWKKIFIVQRNDSRKTTRLITAKSGFIANAGERSEIVLENAGIVTFDESKTSKFSLENVDTVRLSVQTKRGELVRRLSKSKEAPEEMGLGELWSFAEEQTGSARTEAFLLWQRRVILSLTPLIFALLGTGLVTKFNRGSRGLGIVLALAALVIYYALTLVGEQLARTGSIGVPVAGALPVVSSIIAVVWLLLSRPVSPPRLELPPALSALVEGKGQRANKEYRKVSSKLMLDRDIVKSILKNYLLTLGFLMVMFNLFTAFELWKFAGTIENGVVLLTQYLFFLIPFIFVEVAPSALMVSALATYVIKTRQNEVVTWASAGRSVYRILVPGFLLALVLGTFNFAVQEFLLPYANRTQDALRAQIRSRNEILSKRGDYWVAGESNIVSFQQLGASDNEEEVENLSIYRFDREGFRLSSIVTAPSARWEGKTVAVPGGAIEYRWDETGDLLSTNTVDSVVVGRDPFKASIVKPNHLSVSDIRRRLENTISVKDRRAYEVALHRKLAAPFLPLIVVLLTAPFALSIHRKGNVVTIAYAAALWLVFMGTKTLFEQLGQSGMIPPSVGVWVPLLMLGLVGLILLSRVRT